MNENDRLKGQISELEKIIKDLSRSKTLEQQATQNNDKLEKELRELKQEKIKLETTLKTSESGLVTKIEELTSKLKLAEQKATLETSEKDAVTSKYNNLMAKRAVRDFPGVAKVRKPHSKRVRGTGLRVDIGSRSVEEPNKLFT